MDSFLLMLSVALGALCAVLLLKIAFGEKREETDTAALEAAIRDALDRNSDVAEARHNRLEMRLTQANSLNREGMEAVRRESLDLIRKGSESQAARLTSMESSLAAGINAVNETVFQKLTALQAQNDAKLEQMRSTVEEKLQTTLQTRLSENFRLVATQLQALEEGLGEGAFGKRGQPPPPDVEREDPRHLGRSAARRDPIRDPHAGSVRHQCGNRSRNREAGRIRGPDAGPGCFYASVASD